MTPQPLPLPVCLPLDHLDNPHCSSDPTGPEHHLWEALPRPAPQPSGLYWDILPGHAHFSASRLSPDHALLVRSGPYTPPVETDSQGVGSKACPAPYVCIAHKRDQST